MKILAADDEELALDMLTEAIENVVPKAEIFSFKKASELLEFARNNTCEIAFLDINMRGMTGVELAEKLRAFMPEVNIIFVTGFDDYTGDAMAMHASGYIMKPVNEDKIRKELEDLRYPVADEKEKPLLSIKCFGNFDVYDADGKIVHFDRSKAKETLAYLVYKAGTSCSVKELAAQLFEDSEYDRKQQIYMQKIVSSMILTLKKAGAEDIILKSFNSMAIDKSRVNCDYYRFMEKDESVINTYSGEFMAQYPWAEFVVGYLEELYWSSHDSMDA